MDTIRVYIETMFRGVAENEEIRKLKEEIFYNMEERYQELKAQGESENEAVGTVISEFGNIDELLNEMGYSAKQEEAAKEERPVAEREEVIEYIAESKRLGKAIGNGVSLIICSLAVLILGNEIITVFGLSERLEVVFLALLLLGICTAVGMFVYYGMRIEKYEMIEKGKVTIDWTTKNILETDYQANQDKYRRAMVAGIMLCCVCVVPVLVGDAIQSEIGAEVGIAMMFVMVAVACRLFISNSIEKSAYVDILRKKAELETPEEWENYYGNKDYTKAESKMAAKWIGRIHSVLWPIATCIYLIIGFTEHLWHPGWIIFVIAAVVGQVFAIIVNMVFEKKN